MYSPVWARRARPFFAWVLVASLFVGTLPLGACAAPAQSSRTTRQSTKKKTSKQDQEKRIELLEKQLEQQNQLLRQMQQQLEGLRKQATAGSPSPAPGGTAAGSPPSPGAATGSPAPGVTAGSPPAPGSAAGSPGSGVTAGGPPSSGSPGTPATSPGNAPDSVILDDSVPPAPGQPGPGPTSPSQQAAAGPGASPSPGGPLLDDTVPSQQAPETVPASQPQAGASSQGIGGGAANALNPAISAIGLFEVRSSSDKSNLNDNKPSVREVELAIQAPIDPYARYDLFLTIPSGGSLSVEEAYATFLSLPLGFQAKMGQVKSPFGRNNQLHCHAFPQIDRPKVVEEFFGEEGLGGAGVVLSNVLPLPWYSEFTVQGMANDNDTLFSAGTSQKPIWVANWRNMFDLREDLTLDLGLSGAYGSNCSPTNQDTRVAGASLTLKYKPLRTLGNWALTWETEYLTEMQRVPTMVQANPDVPAQQQMTHQSANGLYSYIEFQPNRNWFFDVRYDWTHLPSDPSKVMNGWTGLVGYRFSEFNSVRLQYSQYKRNWDKDLRQLFFQWNVVIGPHGAHKY